ncbi:MAG: 3-oxoacyl-[acyl-carrier-protein] reductase FabG [Verrucomicrobiae bacterium]|nr:3-oxoacyl-[acyl-carrier-protein] reductase FabG [Verrucomicrobiae bacterium]
MNVNDLLSLKQKVALVSGGVGRYGLPIVEGLAEAGATVIATSRSLAKSQAVATRLQGTGLLVHGRALDQADHQSVLALRREIEDHFGRLDVFVNNAVAWPMKRYDDPLTAWAESMSINSTGMFDLLREMAQLIARGGGGTIVNISSMFGVFGPDFSNYTGTEMDCAPDYPFQKGGMIALTKYLARKLAPQKIRVNCISPGGIYNHHPEPFLSRYVSKVPLGRMANHDDIKGVVVFFASAASSYVTGENLVMDGGLHA